MKENIESKNIGNRKFIIELRYEPKVTMLDSKGALVEKIQETKVFPCSHWEIGQSEVVIRDDKKKEDAHNVILVSLNRISFISYKVDSVESFLPIFPKCMRLQQRFCLHLLSQELDAVLLAHTRRNLQTLRMFLRISKNRFLQNSCWINIQLKTCCFTLHMRTECMK